MTITKLLLFHAFITLAAGIVLIVNPGVIPETINIHLDKNQYLICYLLGASEIAMAFLSFSARQLKDIKAIRLISMTFILFHLLTALVELLALLEGTDKLIIANILVRIMVVTLFYYYGLHKSSENTAGKHN